MTALLEPARLGSTPLRNRLVMAPLTRNRATAHGVPRSIMRTYYAQRASAGMIVAEAATPNVVGRTYPNITAIYGPEHVAGWRRVTDAVHAEGGRMFLQIQHGGRVGHPETSGHIPLAPSPIPLPGTIVTPNGHRPTVMPREMTADDIAATVADFAQGARNAMAAGFDGVEVHGANGYLIHQFMSGNTNHRSDGYGGDAEGRTRFAVEVIKSVAEAIGPGNVGFRVSPYGTANGIEEADTEDIYDTLFAALQGLDLAYAHVAFADPGTPTFNTIRASWHRPLIANPKLPLDRLPDDGGKAAGERLIEAGADLVSFGRAFLANPDLVERLRIDAPLNPVRDKGLMYTGDENGYIDYPTLAESAAQTVAT
ncbi:alkene reductase [Actinomadura sp. NAK00032]|uniref:alkene reductase n=1 Tax=Actinomadura sp. NAK00032 TaxID=2742128 RepID=UPI0015914037|nr:alkene reductase [Actinomadura sp. NAK00032]QKW38442.1 alkene reductase [Actinomadura sp. NAK00032]